MHIDYAFLFGASPGGLRFESAPFKCTRECVARQRPAHQVSNLIRLRVRYVELLGGTSSASYHAYCSLFAQASGDEPNHHRG